MEHKSSCFAVRPTSFPMDRRPSQHTHDEHSQSWAREHPLGQNSQEQNMPSYDPGSAQDRAHLVHPQAPYPNWYQGGDPAHMHTTYESTQQTQWSTTYPSPELGGYYNQQILTRSAAQIPYHPPPYASQSVPQEQAPGSHSSWPDGRSTQHDPHTYLQPQYPQNPVRVERYATSSSLPESGLGHSVPQATRGRGRDRPTVISRSSSQTFSPYTSTALQSPRDSSPASVSAAEFFVSRTHTPYGESSRHGSLQPASTSEPSTRTTENAQFVVPSSRIARTEVSPHPSVTSQPSTPRTSHSPEVSTETKPKRRRANATQLRVLNETYSRTMFPTTEERAEMARRINMTPRQVQIWFQNRRQASRQTQVPDSPVTFGSQDPGISQHGLSGPPSTTSEYHEGSSSYTSSGADGGPPYDTEREDV